MKGQMESAARRVLVVDDEPSVCDTIEMILKFDGYQVQTANSGKDALALLEQHSFDVVVTDYSMPEMRGDALVAAIKQRLPDQPVVMVTAHETMLKASGKPLTGVGAVVNKPFDVHELRDAVAKVLQ